MILPSRTLPLFMSKSFFYQDLYKVGGGGEEGGGGVGTNRQEYPGQIGLIIQRKHLFRCLFSTFSIAILVPRWQLLITLT